MSMNFRIPFILFPAVIPFLMGCEDDQVLQETIQNASPVARLATVEDCIRETRPVILDASASTDDRTEAGLLEYRLDWDSDGYYDTPWSTDPVFTHTYPAGIHAARVQVRDEGYLKSSALCSFAVLPERLPVGAHIKGSLLVATLTTYPPVADPLTMFLRLELANETGLWSRNMSITVSVHDYYRKTKLADLPVEVRRNDTVWDGTVPADSTIEVVAINILGDGPLFDPPCGGIVFMEVCISGSDCWAPKCIRTAPFTFYCIHL